MSTTIDSEMAAMEQRLRRLSDDYDRAVGTVHIRGARQHWENVPAQLRSEAFAVMNFMRGLQAAKNLVATP